MRHRRRAALKFAIGALALAALGDSRAIAHQGFPSQTITFVLPFAAGSGSVDTLARAIARYVEAQAGVPVVVLNRPGAMTSLAAAQVARSKPDGYTIFFTAGNSTFAANTYLFKTLPFDPLTSFAPVTTFAETPFVLLVGPNSDIKTVADLTKRLKEKKDKGSYGASTPIGTFMSEWYKSIAGLETFRIPYKSLDSAVQEMGSGGLDFIFVNSAFAAIAIEGARARGLAVTSAKRSPLIDLPTMIEAGVPGFDVTSWLAAYAPAGTPRAILDMLSGWINQAMATEDLKKLLKVTWSDPLPGSPDSLAKFHAEEIAKWRQIVEQAKIELQP